MLAHMAADDALEDAEARRAGESAPLCVSKSPWGCCVRDGPGFIKTNSSSLCVLKKPRVRSAAPARTRGRGRTRPRPPAASPAPPARPRPTPPSAAAFELSARAVRVEAAVGEAPCAARDPHPLHAVRRALAVVLSRALVGGGDLAHQLGEQVGALAQPLPAHRRHHLRRLRHEELGRALLELRAAVRVGQSSRSAALSTEVGASRARSRPAA